MIIRDLITAHRAAWYTFQVAPEGEAAQEAEDAAHNALDELCMHPVGSADDLAALKVHLEWYVSEDGEGQHAEPMPVALVAAMRLAGDQ